MASTIYSKIFVLIDILIGYVLRNHLVGHIPRTAAKVSPRPQMSPPELLLQMLKFGQQMMRRLPFQPLQQPADCHLRRNRHEQMHVVLRHVSLHDLHLVLSTDVPNQISYPRGHLAAQRGPPILRYPDQMQMDLEYSMRAAPVICHPTSLICGARAEAVA